MRIILPLIIAMAACSQSKPSSKQDSPPIPWVDIKSVPEPSEGSVVPLPGTSATDAEKDAMNTLGVPYDGFVISESKLMAAAELRVYAEQLHADAVTNKGLGVIWTDVMWRDLQKAQDTLDEIDEQQNSWWGRNKDTVFFGAGFALGSVSAILMTYGLHQATN